MVDFLSACIKARVNIVISGGTGSGKTTLLNALSRVHPRRRAGGDDRRRRRAAAPAAARRPDGDPAGQHRGRGRRSRPATWSRNALRMRPDRIIIGECRGPEALDMLQAMNTGHDGSMTTIHANDTRDAISRLEMMVGMAGFDLPIWIIRRQIASAIQLIVQVARLSGGVRKIIKISEITGMEGDVISMHDIFAFKQTGVDEDRRARATSSPKASGPIASSGWRPAETKFPRRCSRRVSSPACESRGPFHVTGCYPHSCLRGRRRRPCSASTRSSPTCASGTSARIRRRIEESTRDALRERVKKSPLFKDLGQLAAATAGQQGRAPSLRERLDVMVEQSGLGITSNAVIGIAAVSGLAVGDAQLPARAHLRRPADCARRGSSRSRCISSRIAATPGSRSFSRNCPTPST